MQVSKEEEVAQRQANRGFAVLFCLTRHFVVITGGRWSFVCI